MAGLSRRLSLTTRGARYHIAVAISLITIIPALALTYIALSPAESTETPVFLGRLAVMTLLIVSIALGYVALSKYPLNIAKLRRYLEDIVNGKTPEKVVLLRGMADIPAIENSLNIIMAQLNQQVERMEQELNRIEWLLTRRAEPRGLADLREYKERLPSAAPRSAAAPHSIFDSVGPAVLADLMGDYLDLLETSAFVFEADGQLSLEIMLSDWSRTLQEAARRKAGREAATLPSSDVALLAFPAWRTAARKARAGGEPVDMASDSGLRIYCAPVWKTDSIIGAIGFEYGDPPQKPDRLWELAERYGEEAALLRQKARAYETRPRFIISLARNRLVACARLVSEIVERRETENVLRANEEELRQHRDHLEERVAARTAELREANARLAREVEERRRAESLKDDFISTVSHELRTPLAITREGISLLLDGIPGEVTQKQRKVLDTSFASINRLARIINDLLDISRIEAGRMEIERCKADLNELVDQTVGSLQGLAKQRGLTLTAQVAPRRVDVYVDVDRMVQVLTNLVGNAVKFTDEGEISVTCAAEDDHAVCRVRDTGRGIAPEDLPHVFSKFRQFGRKDGAGDRGTGLGLAIAKNILELHGGRIHVDSTLGRGTTFAFDLPLYSPERALIENLNARLEEDRDIDGKMTLMLFEIECPDCGDEEIWAHTFQKGYMELVRSGNFGRATDTVCARERSQIILLGAVKPPHADVLRRRLTERVAAAFRAADAEFDVTVRAACVTAPEDGLDAESLLEQALTRLIAERRIAA